MQGVKVREEVFWCESDRIGRTTSGAGFQLISVNAVRTATAITLPSQK